MYNEPSTSTSANAFDVFEISCANDITILSSSSPTAASNE